MFLQDWIQKNGVLSIVLKDNLHQPQVIVKFIVKTYEFVYFVVFPFSVTSVWAVLSFIWCVAGLLVVCAYQG